MEPETYPEFFIQCDWDICLKDVGCKVWVTLKEKDQKGIHGTVCRISENGNELTASDGFRIISYKGNSLHIGHESTGRTTMFLAAVQSISDIHSKSISTISVNSLGHAVTAGADEKVLISDTLSAKVKVILKGHVGDVYRCKYFPSGEVVLSCGSDMRVMIWCAKTGVLAVTLVGHTMAVTDVDFVERGKNVISVSKDGSLKLWNCGDKSCLATVFKHSSGINCCQVFTPGPNVDLGEPTNRVSEKECGTEGKAVLLGCEDGLVHCVGLRSRSHLFTVSAPSAVNCVSNVNNKGFLFGCQDGSIHLYNMMLKQPTLKKSWHSSNSSVHSLIPYKDVGFFSSRADGTVTFHFFQISTMGVSLTGANADPVYELSTNSHHLYSCSRDSVIRVYSPYKLIDSIMGKGD